MNKAFSYEEYLEQQGELTYTNVGVSMLPLLRQGKDLFTVRRKDPAERCRAGDVVLYTRPPDKYILHRVIEVRPEDYVILGDNCIAKEYGIRDEEILGIMTGYVRGGKPHTVEEPGYRCYSFVMMHTIPIRVIMKKARLKAGRLLRRVWRKTGR